MPLTKHYERFHDGSGARRNSDYIQARAAVTASEQITIPDGARYVVFSSTLPFHFTMGTNPTAAVPADTDDGTAHELVIGDGPIESRTFICGGEAKIAVAAASATMITATFYR
jgi:hypothetical protein